MSFFTSKRERNLWIFTAIVLIGIFSTLAVNSALVENVIDREYLGGIFSFGVMLIWGAILTQGLKIRPGGIEILVVMGIIAVYLLLFARMKVPEERSHLLEYSILALFIYEIILERIKNGKKIPRPALLAIVVTSLIGVFDEVIQLFIPNRVFDTFDILFNFLATILAIGGSLILDWVRRKVKSWKKNE